MFIFGATSAHLRIKGGKPNKQCGTKVSADCFLIHPKSSPNFLSFCFSISLGLADHRRSSLELCLEPQICMREWTLGGGLQGRTVCDPQPMLHSRRLSFLAMHSCLFLFSPLLFGCKGFLWCCEGPLELARASWISCYNYSEKFQLLTWQFSAR